RGRRVATEQIDQNGGIEDRVDHHEYRGGVFRIFSTYSAPLCSSPSPDQAPISGAEAISPAVSPAPRRSSSVNSRSSAGSGSKVTATRPRGNSGGSSTSRCPSSVTSPSILSAIFILLHPLCVAYHGSPRGRRPRPP